MRAFSVCAPSVAACLAAMACSSVRTVAAGAQHGGAPGTAPSLAAVRGRIEAARGQGTLASIAAEAEAATRARPDDATSWYALGLVRFAQTRERDAIDAFSHAVGLRPDDADLQYRLGVALLDAGEPAQARGPLSRAAELAPRLARYRAPLAVCLDRLGAHGPAMDVLREVPRLAPDADEAAHAVKTARALTDPFRDLPPEARADVEIGLGYLEREAPGLALQPLESMLERFPEVAAAHLLVGLTAERLDESARAVTELKRAAELAPNLPQPHAYLAELYAAKDRPELAAAEYVEAVRCNPLDLGSLRKLGILRLDRLKLPAAAIEPLQRAAALAPADGALQALAARAELAGGQPAASRDRLESLASRLPEDPEVLLRLALVLYEERARSASPVREVLTRRVEQLLSRVLSLQPGNAAASQLLAALKTS